jgi:hypothetical protein
MRKYGNLIFCRTYDLQHIDIAKTVLTSCFDVINSQDLIKFRVKIYYKHL